MTPKLKQRLQDASVWIADRRETTVARLIRWCNQNSSSLDVNSLHATADLLREDFGKTGIKFDAIPLPQLNLLSDRESWHHQDTGPLLAWHHQPAAARRLLLMIHYDTVYPPDAVPDVCVADDNCLIGPNRLTGPGTADAKGGIAVIHLACQAILKFGLAEDIGISILLNPDEEVGTSASASIIREQALGFDQALVFEPTLPDGSFVAGRKGSGNFVVVVHGRSAHAGRNPQDGRNAIVHLSKLIPELVRMGGSGERGGGNDVLVNIGRIVGGGPLNRVPDHAAVQLNVRVADVSAMEKVRREFSKLVSTFSDDDYRVAFQGDFHSPPKTVDRQTQQLQGQVERAAAVAQRTVKWKDTGGACDGSKLAHWGLPNVDTMGVSGGGLHSPEEFCDLNSLCPAALTVAALVAEMNSDA